MIQNYIKMLQALYKHIECICDAKRERPGFDRARSLTILGLWVSIAPLPAARFAAAAGLRAAPCTCREEVVLDYSRCKWDALDGILQHHHWVYQEKNCFPRASDGLKYMS